VLVEVLGQGHVEQQWISDSRPAANQLQLFRGEFGRQTKSVPIRVEGPIRGDDTADCGVARNRAGEVHVHDLEAGHQGSIRRVRLIDGTGFAHQRHVPTALDLCRQGKRKSGFGSEILYLDADVFEDLRLTGSLGQR
jgi:hypothetical protein